MNFGAVLVTGASGFFGKNLIPELIKVRKIRILARPSSNIQLFKGNKDIEIVYGDLENNQAISEALNGVDIIIHCAARTIGRNFTQFYKTNTLGTANLIQAIAKRNIKGIIYLSSHTASGPSDEKRSCTEIEPARPISFYGMTKKFAEDIIKRSDVPYIILRPVSVYGPYDMEILKYIKLLNNGVCPIIGYGEKYLNLIYVNDLVHLVIKIVEAARFHNQTYFVNDGKCYSFTEILDEIARQLNRKNFKIHIPESIALFFGLMNDIFLPKKKRLVGRDKIRELAREYWLCSNESFTGEFGFTPKYSLERGMAETINWYRKYDFIR